MPMAKLCSAHNHWGCLAKGWDSCLMSREVWQVLLEVWLTELLVVLGYRKDRSVSPLLHMQEVAQAHVHVEPAQCHCCHVVLLVFQTAESCPSQFPSLNASLIPSCYEQLSENEATSLVWSYHTK